MGNETFYGDGLNINCRDFNPPMVAENLPFLDNVRLSEKSFVLFIQPLRGLTYIFYAEIHEVDLWQA